MALAPTLSGDVDQSSPRSAGYQPCYAPRTHQTVADALGAGDPTEALAVLFEELALSGYSVPELVATAAHMATERLPRGMALTQARPGCWESSLFDSMAPEDAVLAGPGPEPLDVECPRCFAPADERCRHWTHYTDLKHPHRERIDHAKRPDLTYIAERDANGAPYGWC